MTQPTTLTAIREAATRRYIMWEHGIHGPSHWRRVSENAFELTQHPPDADELVCQIFAWIHDSCRENDVTDPQHGKRAANFAESLRGDLIQLDDDRFELLHYACTWHEHGKVTDDPTIGCCWDADRLDLGRVGIRPDPELLSTSHAQKPEVIEWGWQRSRGNAE